MNENSTPVPLDDQVDSAPGTSVAQPATRDSQLATRDFPRMSGGQPGNQNARKNGLYSRYLPSRQREDYEEARQIKGVAAERALLRAKLAGLLANDPDNAALINKIVNTIIKLDAACSKIDAIDTVAEGIRRAFAGINLCGSLLEASARPEEEG